MIASSLEGAARIIGALIARPLRGTRTTWGATLAEVTATYPGDNFVPQPMWEYTHAVDVAASPDQVWPWLVQIGQGRGGFYSYQGLENLAGCKIRNTTHILPEFGSLCVGDEVNCTPGRQVCASRWPNRTHRWCCWAPPKARPTYRYGRFTSSIPAPAAAD